MVSTEKSSDYKTIVQAIYEAIYELKGGGG